MDVLIESSTGSGLPVPASSFCWLLDQYAAATRDRLKRAPDAQTLDLQSSRQLAARHVTVTLDASEEVLGV